MSKLIAVLMLSLCSVTAAYADHWRASAHVGWSTTPASTPEVDPASAAAGLTLLLGSLAVLRGRAKK